MNFILIIFSSWWKQWRYCPNILVKWWISRLWRNWRKQAYTWTKVRAPVLSSNTYHISLVKSSVKFTCPSTELTWVSTWGNCKLQDSPKNLGLNCHLSTYLPFFTIYYYFHTRDCSQFQSKFKIRQSQGLPLSWLWKA